MKSLLQHGASDDCDDSSTLSEIDKVDLAWSAYVLKAQLRSAREESEACETYRRIARQLPCPGLVVRGSDIVEFITRCVRGGRTSPIKVVLLGMLHESSADPLPDWMVIERREETCRWELDYWLQSV